MKPGLRKSAPQVSSSVNASVTQDSLPQSPSPVVSSSAVSAPHSVSISESSSRMTCQLTVPPNVMGMMPASLSCCAAATRSSYVVGTSVMPACSNRVLL
jgi:hypothetical protein